VRTVARVVAVGPCRAGSIAPITGEASTSVVLSNASISLIAPASSALQNRDIGEKSLGLVFHFGGCTQEERIAMRVFLPLELQRQLPRFISPFAISFILSLIETFGTGFTPQSRHIQLAGKKGSHTSI